jgi:hypothetical protein
MVTVYFRFFTGETSTTFSTFSSLSTAGVDKLSRTGGLGRFITREFRRGLAVNLTVPEMVGVDAGMGVALILERSTREIR